MSSHNRLLETCLKVQLILNKFGWSFCFIGGIAVQRWGDPRFTADVDLTLLTRFENDKDYIQKLLSCFESRKQNALEFALTYRVLLLKDSNGVAIDISLGGLPFEERTIERSSTFSFAEGYDIVTCSAEDLIIHKGFANRDKDWGDIKSIFQKNRGRLNLDTVRCELTLLADLKEDDTILPKLEKLISETYL